jgi:hypothetical protein
MTLAGLSHRHIRPYFGLEKNSGCLLDSTLCYCPIHITAKVQEILGLKLRLKINTESNQGVVYMYRPRALIHVPFQPCAKGVGVAKEQVNDNIMAAI